MGFKLQVLFLFLFLSLTAQGAVQVAFFQGLNAAGNPVELTPGGQFVHTAISIDGTWFHASAQGVVERPDLKIENHYLLVTVLTHPTLSISKEDLAPYLGLAFDYTFSWHDSHSTYCSKFIAQLLGVTPRPMEFAGEHWRLSENVRRGELGVSPDYLFTELLKMGFTHSANDYLYPTKNRNHPSCSALF